MPNRALTNIDIEKYTRNIPYFRGVYMRDELPVRPLDKECAIINLDSARNSGTHWVAFAKYDTYIEYFDSFGDLKPPLEIVKYLGYNIHYNYQRFQQYDSFKCGHLCINFLQRFWDKWLLANK